MILSHQPREVYIAHWFLTDGRIMYTMTNKSSYDAYVEDHVTFARRRLRRFNQRHPQSRIPKATDVCIMVYRVAA